MESFVLSKRSVVGMLDGHEHVCSWLLQQVQPVASDEVVEPVNLAVTMLHGVGEALVGPTNGSASLLLAFGMESGAGMRFLVQPAP